MIIGVVAYHKKVSRWKRKIATSATSPRTTIRSSFGSKAQAELLDPTHGVVTPDAMTKNKVHDDLSETSSIRSKHSSHGRPLRDSIAEIEPDVKCEHSICKHQDHDHAVNITESQHSSKISSEGTGKTGDGSTEILSRRKTSEDQHKKDTAGPLAKKGAYSTAGNQDRSNVESKKNVQSAGSTDFVAKRTSYATMGQVSHPVVIKTIFDDQDQVSKKESKDSAIEGNASAESFADPTKRRPRAMTDDSDRIALYKGRDSTPRITSIFSDSRRKSELNTLVKKGTPSEERAYDMPKRQSGSDMLLTNSTSEADGDTKGIKPVLSENLVEDRHDHSNRARPCSSVAALDHSPLAAETKFHSKSDSQIGPSENKLLAIPGKESRLLAWSHQESANAEQR